MGRYHSKNAKVYMAVDGSGAAVPVTGISSWTFDGSTDKVDATGIGDTNKITVTGLPNANGTFNFFWDDLDDTVFDAADSGVPVRMYLYRDAVNAPSYYRYGFAYVDISESAGVSAAMAGSGTFSGSGAWARKP